MDMDVVHPESSWSLFKLEQEFDIFAMADWFDQNLKGMAFHLAGLYLLLTYLGQKWMAKRPPYTIRGPLFCWNLILAIFSIFGTYRTVPGLFQDLSNKGLYYSVCYPKYKENDTVLGMWSALFALSKLPEMGDTFFIILRKQQLIFLHWYHHVTVFLFAWMTITEFPTTNRIPMAMNFTIHSVMYSYYAIRAARYRVPRFISMFITTGQILQMVIGTALYTWVFYLKQTGEACQISNFGYIYGFLMYLSYFIGFSHFFYKAYICKPVSRSITTKDGVASKKIQ